MKAFHICLPPLNEQRRIVAKIDALMARSRRAKESLDAIPPLLERLRQSILAAAFRGDLTADWRAQNPDVEPAEKLLERIRTERRRRWEEATLEKMRAKGKAPTGDGWKVKYEEPARLEDEELPTLPATWAWATAESCASEITVGHVGPMASRYVVRGIPFLRSQNVRENRFDPTGLTFIAPEFDAELPKSRVNPGDVLVVRSGAPGTACVAPAELGVANCADLVIVRPLPHINAHLLCRFLNSTFGRSRTRDEQVGVAQQHFNVGSMKRTAIPILPVAEQTELERRLTALMDYVSNLEATTRALEPDCIRLDRAILAKAFRGELVPQDPNDEPAEQMLARLASTEAPTKTKRGRPRQKGA